MSPRQRLWLGLAGLALLAALLALLRQIEPVYRHVELGPTAQVRANPWLAAGQFLQQRRRSLDSLDSLAAALARPAAGHSLLLPGSRQRLSSAEQRRLLDWSAAGGHLIVAAGEPENADPLLAALGIRLVRHNALPATAPLRHPQLARLSLPGQQIPALLAFDTQRRFDAPGPPGMLEARSAYGLHLLQRPWGEGRISVLSDASLWRNERIGLHDHAWLLDYLTRDSQVLLLAETRQPNLWQLLRQHYPEALLALALLLGLLLWHLALRLGPPLPEVAPPRRALGEHLLASAAFLARQQGRAALLDRLQQELLAEAVRRHPELAAVDDAERLQRLARLLQETPAQLAAVLSPLTRRRLGAGAFTRQVAHLQRLRNRL